VEASTAPVHNSASVRLAVEHPGVRSRLEAALAAARIPTLAEGGTGAPCVVAYIAVGTEPDRVTAARQEDPEASIVVCSPPAGPRAVRKAIEDGADGLVWESDVEIRLAATVAAVMTGQIVVPRELWRRMERPELTNREKQVLGLVVMGMSNGEIASKLYLTESTVKSHLSSGFRKLGVGSRAEAARVITDPKGGLGTGILAITPTSSSGRPKREPGDAQAP
jgi:DNA-binding NarL/FixJ family response regulator